MEWFEGFVTTLDYILNTKRKRHITGGILLSISALFGGLAVTIITADKGDNTKCLAHLPTFFFILLYIIYIYSCVIIIKKSGFLGK